MSDHNLLRIVMQASGMYCLVNALFSALSSLARYITLRHFDRISATMWESMRPSLIEPFLYALLLLLPAWFLLVKTDACARLVADMSRPRQEEENEEEPAESA